MTEATQKRTGRPAGSPPNRQAILTAARDQFIQQGYDGATVRSVATAAGVDPALVYHYFGSKDQLLVATLQDMTPFEAAIPGLLAGGTAELGERVIRAAFEAYETSYMPMRDALIGLVRNAFGHEAAGTKLREALAGGGLMRLAEELNLSQPDLRVAMVASELVAVAIARYLLRIEPIASANIESIVAWYGPTVQRYLTAPLVENNAPNEA